MSDDSDHFLVGGKPVADLKVVELRKELEIRSLPKSGNKKELVERLHNFLREEKAEQTSHEQPQQTPTTELDPCSPPSQKSPTATAVPNVVAQYLAQQQIQLQAARRSADKIRASKQEAEESEQKMTTEPSPEEERDTSSNAVETQQQDTSSDAVETQQQDTSSDAVETQQQDTSSDAVETRQCKADSEEDEPVVGVTTADKSAPEKAEQPAEAVNGDIKLENEEEEEREEPADDGGKRRAHLHQGSPMTMASFVQHHKLAVESVAEEVTGGISTAETVAESTRELEIGQVVAQPTVLIKEESSKPPEGQQETTMEGFIRRRPSSPARNPPSRWIHIRNLKRPFTKRALFDLLGKFGAVDATHFWMDSIKSTCIATFETEEQAQLARERLHNVVWPVASDLALCVEYSTEEKLKRRKAEEEREASANNSALGGGLGLTVVVDNRGRGAELLPVSGPTVLIQHDKERQKEIETRKRKVEELEKSQKTLDELFKKTKTLPSIYFLPLSDEEATNRRKNLSGDKQQSHLPKNTSDSHRRSGGDSSRHRQSAGGESSRRSGGGGDGGGHHRQSRR